MLKPFHRSQWPAISANDTSSQQTILKNNGKTDGQPDAYGSPETVTVRHILIRTPTSGPDGKIDQARLDAARKRAEDVLKQLKGGASFAELAKKYSEDPATAQNGGLLPPLTKGLTVSEFEQAAFNTPVGQTTNLHRTVYGFHIIRVEARQQAQLKPSVESRSVPIRVSEPRRGAGQ